MSIVSKEELDKAVIENFLRRLTGKQRKLILEACHRPIVGSSGASISNVGVGKKESMGGLIGTLKRDKIEKKASIIAEIMRDDNGNKVYGINEKLINKKDLLKILQKIEDY